MPSAKRFAFVRETVRNHPLIVATSAATGGVLLGVFFAVQVLATPKSNSDNSDNLGTAKAAVEAKAAPKPEVETTGSAPRGDSAAAVDCDQQTWPYFSAACLEEFRSRNRATRVVSTDKLDKHIVSAIEAQPPAPVAASAPPPARQPVPAVKPVAPSTQALTAAQTPEAPAQAAAKNDVNEKRAAKKAKRKLKGETKKPVKQDLQGDDSTIASDSDDRADDRTDRRPDRRRIVDRWIERDYEVPDSRGGGSRRVTVIRRSGMFSSFGN